jgi:serine/threonine protein kinase
MSSAGHSASSSRLRRRIGRYTIVGRIGKGGMGMVYRGRDEVLEREVAVKTLTIEGTLDEESRQRFEIEAKAAARLQHPNIVTVFELGEERGLPFIAMELLPGVDLESLLRSGEALLLREKLEVLIQVLRGLQYAHEHRIVHRDVKPSNIRLLEDGTAKIMDFGIAKLGSTGVTKAGMMVGTVHYMSPEQVRGRALDGRSDVFSVGVILHEMLSGQRPFQADAATAVLYKIVSAPHPRLGDAARGLPPGLQEIVDRALAKDPEQRYPSAGRMADDLARLLADLGTAEHILGPEKVETVNLCRRLLKEGRVDESLRRIREVIESHPDSLEARRVLRAGTRELVRRQGPPPASDEEFPELEATFMAAPTRREPEPGLPSRDEAAPSETTHTNRAVSGRLPSGRALVYGAAAAAVLAVGAGLFLVSRGGPSPGPKPGLAEPIVSTVVAGSPEKGPTPASPVPATPGVRVPVTSDPVGATVTVDGTPVAGVTPLSVTLQPGREHHVRFARDGHAPQEVVLPAAGWPAEVRAVLEPSGPLGKVTVLAAYPVDAVWRGRVLSRAQAGAQLSLPAGRQVITLVSASHFLRATVTADVPAGGATAVEAPALGKISIRANPDNCQVFIDGGFVDYPPILDRAIAVGRHRVSFTWPDGGRYDETAEVARGVPTYVMGRKD